MSQKIMYSLLLISVCCALIFAVVLYINFPREKEYQGTLVENCSVFKG